MERNYLGWYELEEVFEWRKNEAENVKKTKPTFDFETQEAVMKPPKAYVTYLKLGWLELCTRKMDWMIWKVFFLPVEKWGV